MKTLIAIILLVGSTIACESKDSTQNIRDNETPVTAKDVTNNYETERDTTVTISDSTEIR